MHRHRQIAAGELVHSIARRLRLGHRDVRALPPRRVVVERERALEVAHDGAGLTERIGIHRHARDLEQATLHAGFRQSQQRERPVHRVELYRLLKSAAHLFDHQARLAGQRFANHAVSRRGVQPTARLPRRAHDELSVHDLGVAEANPVTPRNFVRRRSRGSIATNDPLPIPFAVRRAIEHDERTDNHGVLDPHVFSEQRNNRIRRSEGLDRRERRAGGVRDREVVHRHSDEQIAAQPADLHVAVHHGRDHALRFPAHALASPVRPRRDIYGDDRQRDEAE